MKIGDTLDVPLHAKVVGTSKDFNGDENQQVVIVCNGEQIARLDLTFFADVPSTEEVKRSMIRRSVAACLADAVFVAQEASEEDVSVDIEHDPMTLN